MKKLLGEERRHELLALLKNAKQPLTGADLAKHTNVSRQVIVNDMNLLKARNEPIVATSQGYIFMHNMQQTRFERKIVCMHSSEQTKEELFMLVDCGVTVENVIVEHPVYGEITASIMVSNRIEVEHFVKRVNETNSLYLSALTDGTHLHVISATSEENLDLAEKKLREHGILVEN
ncbi:transcription repressor NadR [Lysinibacillus sp. 2017]|uniref:transcription repressor NadR n=1 Tax=unclassified Lysinibacillus TaxID=2636778 RepID=UPI000D528BDB|nr:MULTISPECIES: transcription repressor NadR [unclassified Lysinibacillus]AWE08162.1 transcription repressor NadR [Lysinibacillus sp. 2017]TGN36334.1 transcription repressor NadR [Lysinibacillus sp. S2017]